MKLSAAILVLLLVCVCSPNAVPAQRGAAPAPQLARLDADSLAKSWEGTWVSSSDSAALITITRTDKAVLHVSASDRFAATGYVEGGAFIGVARLPAPGWKSLVKPRVMILRFWPLDRDRMAALFAKGLETPTIWGETWRRMRDSDSVPGLRGPEPGPHGFQGEYSEEDLPEVIARVPPEYPDWARRGGLAGTVRVKALVGKDGLVKATRVMDSTVPRLDRYAVDCVRKWRFKPARANGRPLAVWVALTVRFPPR